MYLTKGVYLKKGRYRLEKPLVTENASIIYLAFDNELNHWAVIKELYIKEYCERDLRSGNVVFNDQKGNKDRFNRLKSQFIQTAARINQLDNEIFCNFYDIFEENGTAYCVRWYISGESLADKIKKNGPLSGKESLNYTLKIGKALQYAYAHYINNISITPRNIIVQDNNGEPIITDFDVVLRSESKQIDEREERIKVSKKGSLIIIYLLYYLLAGKDYLNLIDTWNYSPSLVFAPNISHELIKLINEAYIKQSKSELTLPVFLRQIEKESSFFNHESTVAQNDIHSKEGLQQTEIKNTNGFDTEKETGLESTREEKDKIENPEKAQKSLDDPTSNRVDVEPTYDSRLYDKENPYSIPKVGNQSNLDVQNPNFTADQDITTHNVTGKHITDKTKLGLFKIFQSSFLWFFMIILFIGGLIFYFHWKDNRMNNAHGSERTIDLRDEGTRNNENTASNRNNIVAEEKDNGTGEDAYDWRNDIWGGKIDGHFYVNLGLPSGTLWADCNVGAYEPEEPGWYFAWGSITPAKKKYDRPGYPIELEDVMEIQGNPQYDAATANWGSTWQIPTVQQLEELRWECKWEWQKKDKIYGYKITGPNGNSIFLITPDYQTVPNKRTHRAERRYEGHYWSCYAGDNFFSQYMSNPSCFGVYDDSNYIMERSRFNACMIRPVINREVLKF